MLRDRRRVAMTVDGGLGVLSKFDEPFAISD
jgi:hypothetical protein